MDPLLAARWQMGWSLAFHIVVIMVWILGAGAVVLIPSLVFLFRVFGPKDVRERRG